MPRFDDAKVARLRQRAATKRRKAEVMMAEFNKYRGDHAFMFQPNINSSAGRAFTNRRDRISKRYFKGSELLREAEELEARADRLEKHGIPVKGDKQKQYDRMAEKLDEVLDKGSRVYCPLASSNGTIIRKNRLTYRVEFDRGFTWTVKKHFVKPLKAEDDTKPTVEKLELGV